MGGSLGKSSAPPPPDYAGLAAAQGAASKDTAQYNTNANRVNQTGPNGSITWSTRAGADPANPQAGDYTQTTSLSPEQQSLYDSGNRISQQFANTAEGSLGRISDSMSQGFNPQGLPALQGSQNGFFTAQAGVPSTWSGADPNAALQGAPRAGRLQNGVQGQQYGTNLQAQNADGQVSSAPVQSQVNAGNLPQLGGDYEASRNAVTQALLARSTPALDQQQASTENRLKNQGIEQGSEAWNREMQNLGQQRNDAQSQAILAGGQEQSRLAGLAQQDRAQLYGEGLSSGNFANQASGQQFSQDLASKNLYNQSQGQNFQQSLAAGNFANQAKGQQFSQDLAKGNFANQAQAQQYQQGLAGATLNNSNVGQRFNQNLQDSTFRNQAQGQQFAQQSSTDAAKNNWIAQQAQFGNQARQQGLQEQLTERQLPINEINALRSGAQVQTPQFASYYTGGLAQPAPVFDAGVAAGNYATQANAQNQSGKNALLGGLAGLGSAAIGAWGGGG